MNKYALDIINKLVKDRYKDAAAIFFFSSASDESGSDLSALDLVIIYNKLPNAYREDFEYKGVFIDAFIHDIETLNYFFDQVEKPKFHVNLASIIVNSIEIPFVTDFGNSIKNQAQEVINSFTQLTKSDLYSRQFKITDMLYDLKNSKNTQEQMSLSFELYKDLAEIYLLSNDQWIGSGKYLARSLEKFNPLFAKEFEKSFYELRDFDSIYILTKKILDPLGGLFWGGFRNDYPGRWRSMETELHPQVFLNEPTNFKTNQVIYKGLKKYNESKVGPYSFDHFSIHIESDEGVVIAGLIGDVFGKLSRVSSLWVDEKYRKSGLGTKLIEALTNYSIQKKCEIIHLDTASFQAKGFYEKCGFIEVSVLDNHFMGYEGYIMRKFLQY